MNRKRIAGIVASSVILAGIGSTPLAAQTRSTTPVPGEFKIFNDWAVACDNIKSCGGAGLMEKESSDVPNWLTLDLERKAGPSAPAIMTASFRDDWAKEFPPVNSVRFMSGGGEALPFRLQRENGREIPSWRLTLDPDTVKKLLTVFTIRMVDGNGKTLALGSVLGLNATMTYMDDVQGRAGSVTALHARGPKPATHVPAAPAVPFVRSAPRSGAAPTSVTASQIKQMRTRANCDSSMQYDGDNKVERTRLDAVTTLIAIPCASGAYNMSTAYYIQRPGKQPVPAPLDYEMGWGEADVPVLVNSNFDTVSRTLNHHAKGRGIGDCGDAGSWVWDGVQFRLVNKSQMGDCRGSINWLRTWTATSGTAARR